MRCDHQGLRIGEVCPVCRNTRELSWVPDGRDVPGTFLTLVGCATVLILFGVAVVLSLLNSGLQP